MTFDQVLVFHTIVRVGSFKAASGALHRTQPAISQSIKKLEEELTVDLFDRSSYRPILTDHGRAFFVHSEKILNGMHELESVAQSFRNQEEPEISLAVDGISPLPNLLQIFKKFSDRYPYTKLNLGFDILSEAERRVLTKEAQIGITHFVSETGLLEIVPITSVRMLPVINSDFYHERKVSRQEDLLEIDQIVIGDKNPNRGMSFGLLDGGKKWRLSDSNFKRDIILAGLGWGHLPEHSIMQELKDKKLVVINFEDVHPRELKIHLIRLKKQQLGIVAKTLWNELASLGQT
ncbi:MAG: LysR family transcriptional regulator [Bacteriovoracaceae bacterium]